MQLFFGSALLGFLFLVVVYTMSTGVIVLLTSTNLPGGQAKAIQYSETEKYYMIYNVVMSVWWISFLIAFSEFVLSAAVSVWYFTRERSSLYFPLWRGFKLIVRYHLGSVVRGSLLATLFKIPIFVLENTKYLASLCRNSSPGCTDCILKSCICLRCHQKWLRYFSKYSYIFLALFGEDYYEAARKSFYLINRNRERIFVPAKAGDFGMLIIKLTMTLSGTAVGSTLVILSANTPLGQSTSQLVAPVFIGIICFLTSAYVAQIFGGSMQACMNTIIICGACDEEMFTREQRYMYEGLRDYLDKIYEEMTEQQREHKEMVNMKGSKNVYQKTKVADDGGESTSVMRPFFNQHNNEISAPVMALNVDDYEEEEEDIFAGKKPNLVYNSSFNQETKVGKREVLNTSNVSANEDLFSSNPRKNKERSFLDMNQSAFSRPPVQNLSAIPNRSAVEDRNFLSPSREVGINRVVVNKRNVESRENKLFASNEHSRVLGNQSYFDNAPEEELFRFESASFNEEDPILVHNEKSIEVEYEGNRPSFRK